MVISFFLPMIPPTVTHQEHEVKIRNGKPFFYEPPKLKAARAKFMAMLAVHKPEKPMVGPVELITDWTWPTEGKDVVLWKTTKPDTDNIVKLLKDCMTKIGFWKDDAQVCSEITEKFLASPPYVPGIRVVIKELHSEELAND